MTNSDARRYRKMNADVDRQLKRAGLRPMAEAWPPDPVTIGRVGMRADRWVAVVIVVMAVSVVMLVVFRTL